MMINLALSLALFVSFNIYAQQPEPEPKSPPKPPAPAAPVAPTPPPADPAQAESHKNRARVLVDQKDWKGALDEIRQATAANPQSQDAWLIHGTVAMRLELNREALDAFNKYLALSPPADKAAAVKLRVAELEIRVAKDVKAEQEKAAAEAKAQAERFGPDGFGFFFAYSPYYQPKISTESDLHADMKSSFDFGFKFKMVDLGFRLGSGSVDDNMTVKSDKNVVLRTETIKGKYSMWEFFSNINIPLKTPEEGKAGVEWALPLHLGFFYNTVKFSKSYWNMGFNAGAGAMMRYYSGSHLVFDITGLYNFSMPVTAIQNNDAEIETVYNAKGKKAAGSMTGAELRAGLTLLF